MQQWAILSTVRHLNCIQRLLSFGGTFGWLKLELQIAAGEMRKTSEILQKSKIPQPAFEFSDPRSNFVRVIQVG